MLASIETSDFTLQTEYLYEKYSKLLISIISKRIHNQEDIEDCLQDTFVSFLMNKDKIKYSTPKQVRNYLATIANGMAINKFKKSNNEMLMDDCNEVVECSFDFNAISVRELSMLIDGLDEEDKNYIYLTYIYGYTSIEIAEMYQIKSSYVRKHIQRAKEQLRRELES